MWQGIRGHDDVVAQFRTALVRGRLASTFLFVGPEGIGKRTFAVALAKSLLCERRDEVLLDPCGICPSCVQIDAGTHPDLHIVGLPAGKSSIPLALMIGEDNAREGLCYNISLKPFMGGRKIAIIDDADYLNRPEVANCLLKTLEEPPPRSLLILVGTTADKQLTTIRSRAQLVRFRPLDCETVAELLVQKQLISDPAEAQRLSAFCDGSLTRAVELSDPELWTFRAELFHQLARRRLNSIALAQSVVAFVEAAGKEAPPRRARARLMLGFVIAFYRQLLRQLAGLSGSDDDELQTQVAAAMRNGQLDAELTTSRADRSLEALAHIDRNANQSTLLEAWADDLARGRLAGTLERA